MSISGIYDFVKMNKILQVFSEFAILLNLTRHMNTCKESLLIIVIGQMPLELLCFFRLCR